MNKSGKITTEAYGLENLPETGGYIMYPNHQGKYDLLGIITTHDKVLSFVMDKQKSHTMLVREFVDLVQAKRLEKDNPRQGLTIINEVAKDVKNGKRYVLFPEGGYKFNNKNKVQDFKAGSFKIALKSHVPIIPIALIDSYKVFNSFHFGPVTTQVHYLKPIEYDAKTARQSLTRNLKILFDQVVTELFVLETPVEELRTRMDDAKEQLSMEDDLVRFITQDMQTEDVVTEGNDDTDK